MSSKRSTTVAWRPGVRVLSSSESWWCGQYKGQARRKLTKSSMNVYVCARRSRRRGGLHLTSFVYNSTGRKRRRKEKLLCAVLQQASIIFSVSAPPLQGEEKLTNYVLLCSVWSCTLCEIVDLLTATNKKVSTNIKTWKKPINKN